jgi:hypothetical protein
MAALAFADIGIDSGMETESLKVMESLLPQVVFLNDPGQP